MPSSPVRIGRLLLLAAALAGLFAMHGLGDHGSMAAAPSMVMAGPAQHAPAVDLPSHGMAPMGAGCVALLVLALVLLLRTRRVHDVVCAGARVSLRTLVAAPVPRGPPPRSLLCVWRC